MFIPRFRGPPSSMPVDRFGGDADDAKNRPSIVSEKALKDFDEMLKSDSLDGGWAGPQGDIDYRYRHASAFDSNILNDTFYNYSEHIFTILYITS